MDDERQYSTWYVEALSFLLFDRVSFEKFNHIIELKSDDEGDSMSRVPASCPANFAGQYSVNPGDTMYQIASIFRINVTELIRVNPHITNPNLIFPGDVLCVPGQITFPCCLVMDLVQPSELGEAGVALVHTSFFGTQAISVMATLSVLPAGYDTWFAEVNIPNVGSFGNRIYPTPETPPTFSGTIDFPTAASLTLNSTVRVFPANSVTGNEGPVKLQGSLNSCR